MATPSYSKGSDMRYQMIPMFPTSHFQCFFLFAFELAELLKFEAHSSGYDFAKYQPPKDHLLVSIKLLRTSFLGVV